LTVFNAWFTISFQETRQKSEGPHLGHRITANDIYNEIDTLVPRSKALKSFGPGGHLVIINDMVSTQLQ
jgi:hypothetical protein